MTKETAQAVPKYATRRNNRRRSRGDQIAAVAEAMGTSFMPWQYAAADVATEYRVRSGIPYRKTALVTVPRQQGKSVLISSVLVETALRVPTSFSILIAQTRIAATARLTDIANRAALSGLDAGLHFTRGVGNERIRFSNGSTIVVMSPKATSVHGESISGVAVIDEAFAVSPEILSGVIPAMIAQPTSALWVISTAGTEESTLLNDLLDKAREDPQGDVAFTEYSMPDDADLLNDVDRWGEWMPALGLTTSVASIQAAIGVMPPHEARRAFGNISITEETSTAIPVEWWSRSIDDPVPDVGLALAVDVNRSPPGWSISAAWPTEKGYHGDLVHHHHGLELTELPGRVRELVDRFKPKVIGFDPFGVAGQVMPDLQSVSDDFGIPLRTFNGRERAQADMFLVDRLRDETFSHSDMIALRSAAEGAGWGEKGDLWYFDRGSSYADVSPLLAVSMAVYCAYESETLAPVYAIY